jgi:molecular chaperone DnaK
MQASMKLGEAMYQAAQAGGEGGEQPEGEAAQKDDVIDADFQEVDEGDKKKRA